MGPNIQYHHISIQELKHQLSTQKELNKELLRQNFRLLAQIDILKSSHTLSVDLSA